MCGMRGWHDLFRLSAVEMRTPVRYNPVAAVGRVTATSIANDGMIRNMIGSAAVRLARLSLATFAAAVIALATAVILIAERFFH
jgi:hypothetical protein